ncbi:MAG: flavin reductase family protein [Phycisphaerales bacterium]
MDWVPAQRPDVAQALDRIPAGIFILTSAHADLRSGVVVRWAQQCSGTPPMVMVAVSKGHALSPLIRDSRSFALCQLDPADRTVARAFESQTPGMDPFLGASLERTPSGCPVPYRALGYVDCELARHVDLDGDCEIYVGVVHHAATLLDPRDGTACLCDRQTVQRAMPTTTNGSNGTANGTARSHKPATPAATGRTVAARAVAALRESAAVLRKGSSKNGRSRRR